MLLISDINPIFIWIKILHLQFHPKCSGLSMHHLHTVCCKFHPFAPRTTCEHPRDSSVESLAAVYASMPATATAANRPVRIIPCITRSLRRHLCLCCCRQFSSHFLGSPRSSGEWRGSSDRVLPPLLPLDPPPLKMKHIHELSYAISHQKKWRKTIKLRGCCYKGLFTCSWCWN